MAEEAAEARQRRMERRSSKRKSPDTEDMDLSLIKGVKRQARYEPVVPMSKEDLSKWRKEARRVRNRESAAASRRKTREKIDELEEQVSQLQNKYEQALKTIAQLQGSHPNRVSPVLAPKQEEAEITLDEYSLDPSFFQSQDSAFAEAAHAILSEVSTDASSDGLSSEDEEELGQFLWDVMEDEPVSV